MRKLLKIILALVLIIFVLWWILRPKGEIQINIEETLPNAGTISLEMKEALALMEKFIVAAETLSNQLQQKNLRYILSSQLRDNDVSISEIINANFEFELKKDFIIFSGDFQVTPILEMLYGTFGYYDHQVVVFDYKESTSKPHDIKVKAFIRLHPLDRFGKSIPQNGFLPKPLFRSTTSKYLASHLVTNRNNDDCTRKLCLSDLPDNLESLEATMDAFKYLYERRNTSLCDVGHSDTHCLRNLEKQFAEALEQDAHNDFARLGLGLAQLRRVHLMLQVNSSVAVGRVLMEAIANISKARRHEYIKNLMESSEWGEMIKETPGLEKYNITPKFINTADGYRKARRAYVEARYDDARMALESIKELPKPLHPHVENLKLSSKLFLADGEEEADQLLEEYRALQRSESYGAWAASFALHLSRWSRHRPERVQEALGFIDEAINQSGSDGIAFLDRRAQKAMCYALVGLVEDAESTLDEVVADVQEHPKYPGKDLQRIYYNVGISYALIDRVKRASRFLGLAISAHTSYIVGIKQLDMLEKFRDWEGYERWMTKQHQLKDQTTE